MNNVNYLVTSHGAVVYYSCREFLFILPAVLSTLLLCLPSTSVPLSYFILAVQTHKCLEEHPGTSSTFVYTLSETCSLSFVITVKNSGS